MDAYRRKKKIVRPRRPAIVRLLKKAKKYQRLLDGGEVGTQAELALRARLSRPRVTQLLNLLRLAPAVQQALLSLPVGTPERLVTEHRLRAMLDLDPDEQMAWLATIL